MKEVKPWVDVSNDPLGDEQMKLYTSSHFYQTVGDTTTVCPEILDFLRGAEGYEVEWCFLPPRNNVEASPPGDPTNRGELFFRCVGRPSHMPWPAGPYNK